MAGPADFVLNPLPSSVQWDGSLFSVTQVGTPFLLEGDAGPVLYGTSGDLTGDGWPEIVISGWSYRGWDAAGTPTEVPLTVFSTSATGVQQLDAGIFLGMSSSPGTAILRIGDFTGDGRADLMMIGHNESPFVTTESFLFAGGASGFTIHAVGPDVAAHEGGVGDLNGDGLPDLALSAYWAEKTFDPILYDDDWYQGRGDTGQAIILQVNLGGGAFKALPLAFDLTKEQIQAGQQPLNYNSGSASMIADLDGDGRTEIIVSDMATSADFSQQRGDTYIITDLVLGETLASGTAIKLPAPYFEDNPAYAGMQSLMSDLSHDIQLEVMDFDNDGLLDILVFSMVWVDPNESPASIVQFLRNTGDLNFEDVTDEVLFNSWLGKFESSHEARLIDVNGDGFVDIVSPGDPMIGPDGQQVANTWSNEVLINTGAGKFVSVMWSQFTELTLAAGGTAETKYIPYMTPEGRLGFISNRYTADGTQFFDVQASGPIFTGPGGANPALRGAPGFNEAYYLTENPDVAQAVTDGAYASGLDHYLAVGRAQGLAGFAANATVAGSDFGDEIILRDGDERAFGGLGNDTALGGAGQDYLRGEEGNDRIVGGDAFDDLHGNMGDDTVSGGLGGDWVVGGKDNDLLDGDEDHDVVYGNLGNDTVNGGVGNDWVRGGQQDDVIDAGAGDDWIAGDKHNDTITGGSGADIFHTWGEAGLDRVLDFNAAEGDRVNLLAGTTYTVSQSGADTVIDMTGGGQMVLVGVQLSSLSDGWIFGA